MDNLRTLSQMTIFTCTSFRNRKKGESLASTNNNLYWVTRPFIWTLNVLVTVQIILANFVLENT
jgi:hypothetical protein